jgi:predicted unusual protein kinase regulating ubiquinone biosynthesis (AarF/ABC1/UbiB family)
MTSIKSILRDTQISGDSKIIAGSDGDLAIKKSSSAIGKLSKRIIQVIKHEPKLGDLDREANLGGIHAYLHELEKVDKDLASSIKQSLQPNITQGKGITTRNIRDLGSKEVLPWALNKAQNLVKILSHSAIKTDGGFREFTPQELTALEQVSDALNLARDHLIGSGNRAGLEQINQQIKEIGLATGYYDQAKIETAKQQESHFSTEKRPTLEVFNTKLGRFVNSGVNQKDWNSFLQAKDHLELGGAPLPNDSAVRKTAHAILKATGEAKGLRFLERAPTKSLVDLAFKASAGVFDEFEVLQDIQGEFDDKNLDPQSLEMLRKYNQKRADYDQRIQDAKPEEVTKAPEPLNPAEALRAANAEPIKTTGPDEIAVRQFIAQLIYPDNPGDLETKKPAQRIKDEFVKNPAAVLKILHKPELLASAGLPNELVDVLKEQLKGPLGKSLRFLDIIKDEDRKELNLVKALKKIPASEFEDLAVQIDGAVNDFDFAPMKQLAEITKDIDGNFAKFLTKVFNNYGPSQPLSDRKAMIASSLRDSVPTDEPEKQLVAFLKGSGPYLLKILQLMGDEVDDPKLKEALSAVKAKLAPISPEIRKAMLAKIIEDSNGKISDIKEVRSLGAASVGQTFKAKITVQENGQPVEKNVVIKLLRPGIQERAARERRFMEKMAADIPGMSGTFAGIADQIEPELDLRNEADNVRKGAVYNGIGDLDVHAMKLLEDMPASSSYMMIEQASGSTVQSYISTFQKMSNEKVRVQKGVDPLIHGMKLAENLHGLNTMWFEEAMFGSGFYHGDLHGGNIMFNADASQKGQMTVIDFGNSSVLSDNQRNSVFKMMLAAQLDEPDTYVQNFEKILSPEGKTGFTPKLKADFTRAVQEVFARTDLDSMAKVESALGRANQLGIEVPGTISNFSRSQVMLGTALNTVNTLNQKNFKVVVDDSEFAAKEMERSLELMGRELNKVSKRLNDEGKQDLAQKLLQCKDVPFKDYTQEQIDLLTVHAPRQLSSMERAQTKLDRIGLADARPPYLDSSSAIENVLFRHKWDAVKRVGLRPFIKLALPGLFPKSNPLSGRATVAAVPAAPAVAGAAQTASTRSEVVTPDRLV